MEFKKNDEFEKEDQIKPNPSKMNEIVEINKIMNLKRKIKWSPTLIEGTKLWKLEKWYIWKGRSNKVQP